MLARAAVRGPDLLALLSCLLAPPVLYNLFSGVRFEDSYFFFQFARNIAGGQGFAFNPGEPRLATTSPLYTLILAAITWLDVLPIEHAALMLNSVLVSMQALCLYGLLRPMLPRAALLVCALCLCDAFAIFAYLSMDTALFTALCIASCWAIAARKPVAVGLSLGLALLARYDAGLLAVLYAVLMWIDERRLPIRSAAIAGLVFAPWVLFATAYFGSAMPSTLHAKVGSVPYAEFLFDALEWLIKVPGLAALPPLLAGVVALVLLALAIADMRARLRPLVLFAVFGLLHLWAYALIGPPLGEKWHLHVSRVVFGTLLVAGSVPLFEYAARWTAPRARSVLPAAFAVAMVAASVSGTLAHSRELPTMFWIVERDRIYHQVAAFVGEHVRPRQRFMPTEVATLGYLTRMHMIDPFGLLNWSNGYLRTRSRRDHFALVQHYAPDLLLLDWAKHAIWIEQRTAYRTVKVFPWRDPFSVLLVRDPNVLLHPEEMLALRAGAERALYGGPHTVLHAQAR